MANAKVFLKKNWPWLLAGVAAALVVVFLLFRTRSRAGGAQVVSLPPNSGGGVPGGGGGGGGGDTGSPTPPDTGPTDPITAAANALLQYAAQAERQAQMAGSDSDLFKQWQAEADAALAEAANLINEGRLGPNPPIPITRTPPPAPPPPAPAPPPPPVLSQIFAAGSQWYDFLTGQVIQGQTYSGGQLNFSDSRPFKGKTLYRIRTNSGGVGDWGLIA